MKLYLMLCCNDQSPNGRNEALHLRLAHSYTIRSPLVL